MENNTILKALFDLKSEVGTMTKDSTNPFFKSKYFDINQLLEHIEPLARKNNLIILQPIIKGFVRTEIHSIDNGEMVFSEIELTGIKDPQKVGSEITYFRRYTLQSLLGVQAEDDDGNKAAQKPKETPKKDCKAILENCKTLEQLRVAFFAFSTAEKLEFEELKDELKTKLK